MNILSQPPLPSADDGQRSIPSPIAGGAKMDGAANAHPGWAASVAGTRNTKIGQAVPNSPESVTSARSVSQPSFRESGRQAGVGFLETVNAESEQSCRAHFYSPWMTRRAVLPPIQSKKREVA